MLSEVDLKFICDTKAANLSKKYISVVEIIVELDNKSKIKAYGYDETADLLYRTVKKNDLILIEGILRGKNIEIVSIEML